MYLIRWNTLQFFVQLYHLDYIKIKKPKNLYWLLKPFFYQYMYNRWVWYINWSCKVLIISSLSDIRKVPFFLPNLFAEKKKKSIQLYLVCAAGHRSCKGIKNPNICDPMCVTDGIDSGILQDEMVGSDILLKLIIQKGVLSDWKRKRNSQYSLVTNVYENRTLSSQCVFDLLTSREFLAALYNQRTVYAGCTRHSEIELWYREIPGVTT